MDDLVQFLRARLDEDEQIARASKPGPWHADGGEVYATHPVDRVTDYSESADHIARHDPARVLLEVDAKRRVLELHGIVHREIGWLEDVDEESSEIPVCGLCVPKHSNYRSREEVPVGACVTLRLLALAYADHPDCRDDWRP